MSGSRKKKTDSDEVEDLLRAAQDDILLNLTVDSHMSRGSSSTIIDPDLDRRFQALRSKPKPSNSKPKSLLPTISPATSDLNLDIDHDEPKIDDLVARFAALKGSIPSQSLSSYSSNYDQKTKAGNGDGAESVDDEDEVEKLIRWAVDAARLDPSPPSDSDDNEHSDDVDDDDDEDDDADSVDGKIKKKKGQRK